MTRVTLRRIVGYDPENGVEILNFYVPPNKWTHVLSLVKNKENDDDYLRTYDLPANTAANVLGAIGERKVNSLDYYLTCEREQD